MKRDASRGAMLSRDDIVAAREMAERLDAVEADERRYEEWRHCGIVEPRDPAWATARRETMARFGADRAEALRYMADCAERAIVALVTSLSSPEKMRAAIAIMRERRGLAWDCWQVGDAVTRIARLDGDPPIVAQADLRTWDLRRHEGRERRINTVKMIQLLWSAYLESEEAPPVDDIAARMQ